MALIDKKVIMFDLDGTLAESKQPLKEDMAEHLRKLLEHYFVVVISGGSLDQYKKQFLPFLNASNAQLEKLVLMPTSGATLYMHDKEGNLEEKFVYELTGDEKEKIIKHLNEAIDTFKLRPEEQWGELIEDRRTQITYSALGQQAPLEKKSVWDPDGKRRVEVIEYLKPLLPGLSIRSGGTTSIDITHVGIDKAYGVHQTEKYLGVTVNDIIFVGDALYDGGNDAPAKSTGATCVEVKNPEDTMRYIESII